MKIPRYARAKATSDDYVRYQAGRRTWWRALLSREGDQLILSDQVFKTAAEAREYKRKVLERLG